jgi:16S rRNA G1207 methylase RsmC
VYLVDRDALAVEYARQNAALNALDGVEAYASLGYDDLRPTDFGLIASNIPAKAGAPVIEHLLLDAASHLRRDGTVAVVVIEAIAPFVSSTLEHGANIKVTLRREAAGYTVFHYRFRDGAARPVQRSAFERGLYDRGEALLSTGQRTMALRTVHGLDEGEGPSAATRMLAEAIAAYGHPVPHAAVLNPGQGHAPVALAVAAAPERMTLVDRDLLALRISEANLVRCGFDRARISTMHAAGVPDLAGNAPDLIAGVLREDEGAGPMRAMVTSAAGQLGIGGELLLAGSSTGITRAIAALEPAQMDVRERKRRKGTSVARLIRASIERRERPSG